MSTVPIFAPDGSLGDVPYEQMKAALAAGAKLGVSIKAPDGTLGVIPADRYQDAVKAGATIVPIKDQETQHPGFWAKAADDLKGLLHPSGFSPYPGMGQDEKAAAAGQSFEQDQARQKAGYSAPYRALAPVAQSVGVNVPGMEESAAEGDVGGVLGHAAAPAAMLGAGEAIGHGAGPVSEVAGRVVPKAVRTAAHATNAVLGDLPGAAGAAIGGYIGHATGIPEGTLSGVIIGRELGKVAGKALPTMKIPGEGFGLPNRVEPVETGPAVRYSTEPPAEANALAQGGKAVTSPSDALGSIPVRSLSDLPPQAVHQALSELGPKAPLTAVTERANTIAKLSDLLNQGLGGKGLEPNVPIKNQGGVVTPNPAQSSPGAMPVKSHIRTAQGLDTSATSSVSSELSEPQPRTAPTPRESTAIQDFKYDPEAKEMHVTWKGGASPITYVYGEVTPEQSAMFHGSESKGMAAKSIKDNNVLVAKIINGKRVPIKPVVSDEDLISPDEWESGHAIETGVEGSSRQ
jgi:hypothetical protein